MSSYGVGYGGGSGNGSVINGRMVGHDEHKQERFLLLLRLCQYKGRSDLKLFIHKRNN